MQKAETPWELSQDVRQPCLQLLRRGSALVQFVMGVEVDTEAVESEPFDFLSPHASCPTHVASASRFAPYTLPLLDKLGYIEAFDGYKEIAECCLVELHERPRNVVETLLSQAMRTLQ